MKKSVTLTDFNTFWYIMEIQNFHSAGFYASDLDKIINETNKVAIKYFY